MPTSLPPLTPDPASPAAPGEFRIEASREILDLLRSLEQERGRLVLSCPAGVSVQTRLCSVSEGGDSKRGKAKQQKEKKAGRDK